MSLNAILQPFVTRAIRESRLHIGEKNKMSSLTAPVAAGAGPVKKPLEELENEQAYLKSKLTKVKAKIDTYTTFVNKVKAELDAGLGVSGGAVEKYMDIKSEKLPLLVSRGNQIIYRLRVLKDEISRVRQQYRCKELKEEIIAAAFHPRRVEKWLELGGFEILESI